MISPSDSGTIIHELFAKLQEEKSRGRTDLLDTVEDKRSTGLPSKRWLEYFEGIPRKLREEVADYLTLNNRVGAGIKRRSGRAPIRTPGGCTGGRHRPARKLGIGDCAWWWFSFEPRKVTVELGTERNPKNPKMQSIWSFLQGTPIDPGRPKRYPMENGVIYRHSLLKGDELSGPFEKSVKLASRQIGPVLRSRRRLREDRALLQVSCLRSAGTAAARRGRRRGAESPPPAAQS